MSRRAFYGLIKPLKRRFLCYNLTRALSAKFNPSEEEQGKDESRKTHFGFESVREEEKVGRGEKRGWVSHSLTQSVAGAGTQG